MNDVDQAIEIIKKGGVVIFPTDTIYGIGCRIDDEKAVARVFKIRNRPQEKAVLALVDSIAMAQKYLRPIPSNVLSLMKKYWPGKLTIILPCLENKVLEIVRGGGKTLGVRQTNHPLLLQILSEIQVPLIAPSANFSGEKSPESFNDINTQLIDQVDYVLQGSTGGNIPSTVIDCSISPWKIVREGEVRVDLV